MTMLKPFYDASNIQYTVGSQTVRTVREPREAHTIVSGQPKSNSAKPNHLNGAPFVHEHPSSQGSS